MIITMIITMIIILVRKEKNRRKDNGVLIIR